MIRVNQLCKSFGKVTAVDQASFFIPKGSICGFIGPNGAGKTTTLRILATLDSPTSGSASIDGHDVTHKVTEIRQRIGYMPDHYGTYPHMNAAEYLEFFARAYGLFGSLRRSRVDEIVAFTELGELLGRPVNGLSKGQKQRLSLARSLVSDPAVLILDEPAAGLDPRARIELRELLKILAQQEKTVFISSHILTELADLVDRVVIIERGLIRYQGPPEGIQGEDERGTAYRLEVSSDIDAAKKFLLEQPAVHTIEGLQDNVLLLFADERVEAIEELIARLFAAGIRLRHFSHHEAGLEEVFIKMTSSENGDASTSQ